MRSFGGRNSKWRSGTRLWREPRSLYYEQLEDRRMLANLVAADGYLVDYGGTNRLSEVVIGQQVAIRLDWTTTDLPSDIENYQVEFRVDGVPLRSNDFNLGAGQATNSFWWYQRGWYASPGPHSVEIIVDVDNEVLESDEGDNVFTFNFTPVTANFPQAMIWPLEVAPLTEASWFNYNDVDPTSGSSDYLGGNATRDRHNAIDAGVVTFADQDQGTEIYAALDGVVKSINDGEFDRHTFFDFSVSNFVILDHGNGWETVYLHMRRDSVQVQVGQAVSQGDRLGLVGSSGNSAAPHIHFEVRRHEFRIETYYDPTTYWASPVDYVGDNVYLLKTGITNYNPNLHLREGPSNSHILAQQSDIRLRALGYYNGLRNNDLVQSIWRRPNGSVYTTRSFTAFDDFTFTRLFWENVPLPVTPDLGTWQVDYLVNGTLLGHEFFEVTANGEPEIRVEEPSGNIVVDGRFTPFDFGVVNVGTTSPTHTFTVVNHGYETLSIDSLEVPTGYTVTNGLAASLAPGASDTLTVALDTSAGGYFGGEVRIASNDADEPIYNFAVEGIVTSSGVENLIVGIGEFEVVEGDQMVANIRRTGSNNAPLTVALSTDDTTELSLQNTVSFGPGEDYVQFFFDAPSDLSFDGNQRAAIVASASGYYNGRNTIEVVDDLQQAGDFTGDGLVNGADFLSWQRGMSPNPLSMSDLNDWEENYGNPPQQAGDFTGDGLVNGADFLSWQRGMSPNPLSMSDLNDWEENYGNPPQLASASTSETLATVRLGDNVPASLSEPNAFPFITVHMAITNLHLAQFETAVIDQVFETSSRHDDLADPSTILEIRPSLLKADVNDEGTQERELPINEVYFYDFDNLFATLGGDEDLDDFFDS